MSTRRRGNYNLTKSQRRDNMARKKDERAIRQAHQQEKKMESYLADDENFTSFANQLTKLGLQLRDIPGDGNCLFRALGDQFEGHCRNHLKHRLETVQYMIDHRKDFEPFVEDDVPFERHVALLKKPGTYAGNDALAAFARNHKVNIVIHQLNSPVWKIHGNDDGSRELHISYHNGDHYSSVRKLGDNTEAPAAIKLKVEDDQGKVASKKTSKMSTYKAGTCYQDNYNNYDYTNGYHDNVETVEGMARAVRDEFDVIEQVCKMTDCEDEGLVQQVLEDHDYNVDGAVSYIQCLMLQLQANTENGLEDNETESVSSRNTNDSGIWSDNGTGSRIFGKTNSHPHSSSSGSSGAKPKVNKNQAHLSNRQRKEQAKRDKKKRAEEHKKQRVKGTSNDSDDEDTVVISQGMGMLKV